MRVYLPSDALPVLAWKPKEKDMRSGDDHEDENGRCNDRDEMLFSVQTHPLVQGLATGLARPRGCPLLSSSRPDLSDDPLSGRWDGPHDPDPQHRLAQRHGVVMVAVGPVPRQAARSQ